MHDVKQVWVFEKVEALSIIPQRFYIALTKSHVFSRQLCKQITAHGVLGKIPVLYSKGRLALFYGGGYFLFAVLCAVI